MDISTLEKTETVAREFARTLRSGDIVHLIGDMGTGKTTFTQFIAKELGVLDYVNSPTFTLINEYSLPQFKLIHIDLYRIRVAGELIEMGLDSVMNDQTVTLIEWADLFSDVLPPETIKLNFSLKGQDDRTLTLERR